MAEKGETTFVQQCFSGIKQILAKRLRDFPRNTNICVNKLQDIGGEVSSARSGLACFEDVTTGACFNLRWNCK